MAVTLPVEIMDRIASLTKSDKVGFALRDRISPFVRETLAAKNTLVYGKVQGGKTRKIMSFLRAFPGRTNVVVVQNSLAVLNQYETRLTNEGIEFQTISSKTSKINKRVILVMANVYRYRYFIKYAPSVYNLIIDEADALLKACPLKGARNVHVTATPFGMSAIYDRTISLCDHSDYKGLQDFDIVVKSQEDAVTNFLRTDTGVMLVNGRHTIYHMQTNAIALSALHPTVPIVTFAGEKTVRLGGIVTGVNSSISSIIDGLAAHTHIIIIAGRLACRGLSFVSSDYSRHLTAQYMETCNSTVTFLQKMRMSGIYGDSRRLVLSLKNSNLLHKVERIISLLDTFDPGNLISKIKTDD